MCGLFETQVSRGRTKKANLKIWLLEEEDRYGEVKICPKIAQCVERRESGEAKLDGALWALGNTPPRE